MKHVYFMVTEHVKEVTDDATFIHDSTLDFPASTIQGSCMQFDGNVMQLRHDCQMLLPANK